VEVETILLGRSDFSSTCGLTATKQPKRMESEDLKKSKYDFAWEVETILLAATTWAPPVASFQL
jgi:hypothetical protein